jgi:UDP-N-acetylglucosamine 2-epimerase (non-hydrolysing)
VTGATGKLTVMTIVGTRPEIIRLSRVIVALDAVADHVLVHTGQNYDYELNEIFFQELGIRQPDHFLDADPTSLGTLMADVLTGTERLIREVRPHAVVILGDTNSSISAVMARRMKVPIYHLEAGNRSFDPNVPEEVNRKLVDHIADYHLVYSEHSRRNLLAEGIRPETVVLIGSPMREILSHYKSSIEQSPVLDRLGLQANGFILASAHREENVDDRPRLESLIESLVQVGKQQECRVLVSTHPRTRKRLESYNMLPLEGLELHPPLGFFDYINLQQSARCVISDSGTISEESAILGFPAVTIRDAIERPEAIDVGGIITTGLKPKDVVDSVAMTLWESERFPRVRSPAEYLVDDTSRRVVNVIRSTAGTHHQRLGVRRTADANDGAVQQPAAVASAAGRC